MEQFNNGSNNIPLTMPVKRRRGRPRKDKSINRLNITPNLNHPPSLNPVEEYSQNSMVGQQVKGVVEASFDAGYLLNVSIGNSGSCFRGVVFKPGHYLPISAENDVAPHIQMINRNGYVGNNMGPMPNGESLNKGPVAITNGVSQNKESFERARGDISGISGTNDASKGTKISSNTHLGNSDGTNKPLDQDTLRVMNPVNMNHSQEVLEPYNNSRMGPMLTLLQVVQENVAKPGGSS